MRSSALAAILGIGGCIAPSVVESSGRAVTEAPTTLEWRPALDRDLDGAFESELIEGEAAGALLKLYYHFAPDGRYSGAALIQGDDGPAFQTLSGRFTLASGELDLGEQSLARASVAGERLRLESDGTTIVLRRVELR
jgi:hypothetical protein